MKKDRGRIKDNVREEVIEAVFRAAPVLSAEGAGSIRRWLSEEVWGGYPFEELMGIVKEVLPQTLLTEIKFVAAMAGIRESGEPDGFVSNRAFFAMICLLIVLGRASVDEVEN